MTKRFLVFCGEKHYPSQAMYDLKGSFDTEIEALICIANSYYEWWQIVDHQTMTTIYEGERP
jgi:hypothetical protein